MGKVVVTRHPALVEYLKEKGMSDDVTVIEHATLEDVRGQDVIGVLPLSLAAEARTVTTIPLALTPEDRGKELGIERLRAIAGKPEMFKVSRIWGSIKK